MESLQEYTKKIILTLSKNDAKRTAIDFDADKFSELVSMESGAKIESIIPCPPGASRTAQSFRNMLLELGRVEQHKMHCDYIPEEYFGEEDADPFKLYAKAFKIFAKEEAFFENPLLEGCLALYYKVVKKCKADLKAYYSQKLQKLSESVNGVISELRDIFIQYKRSESNEGILISLNQILWVYFTENQFQQCTFYINNISDQLEDLIKGSKKAHSVTLLYYLGRMNLFESNFKVAEKYLEEAFELCHSNFKSHLVKIARFLVPVKIMNGKLPNKRLLKEYNLPEYSELVEAFLDFDLTKFEAVREKYKYLWIKLGLYFILDKIELIILRNIIKKVWVVTGKSSVLDTELYMKAFNLKSPTKFTLDEAECMIGNLILRGYVRGFVHPDMKKVVLSKDKGFPPLGTTGK